MVAFEDGWGSGEDGDWKAAWVCVDGGDDVSVAVDAVVDAVVVDAAVGGVGVGVGVDVDVDVGVGVGIGGDGAVVGQFLRISWSRNRLHWSSKYIFLIPTPLPASSDREVYTVLVFHLQGLLAKTRLPLLPCCEKRDTLNILPS